MAWRGCYRHQLEAGSPAWAEAVAELVAGSEKARVDFEDAGEACPRCYRHIEERLEAAKEAVVNQAVEAHALREHLAQVTAELRDRAAAGDDLARWAAGRPQCPSCGQGDDAWRGRVCCALAGRLGDWERRAVAEALMETEPPAGEPQQGSSVGFYGKRTGGGA